MKLRRAACACALAMSALAPASLCAQMPNLGSMIPDKAAVLDALAVPRRQVDHLGGSPVR